MKLPIITHYGAPRRHGEDITTLCGQPANNIVLGEDTATCNTCIALYISGINGPMQPTVVVNI